MWSDASTVLVDADRLHQGRSQAVCDAGAALDVVSSGKGYKLNELRLVQHAASSSEPFFGLVGLVLEVTRPFL